MTVARELAPRLRVFAVQAAVLARRTTPGTARPARSPGPTRSPRAGHAQRYEFTFDALRAGLAGFITVTDAEIAEAMRLLLRMTRHAGGGRRGRGLAGLLRLRTTLAGQQVGIVLSGANVDEASLRRVMNREI